MTKMSKLRTDHRSLGGRYDSGEGLKPADKIHIGSFTGAQLQANLASGLPFDRIGTVSQGLLLAKDADTMILPGARVEVTASFLRKMLLDAFSLTPEKMNALPTHEQNRITKEMRKIVNRSFRESRKDARSLTGTPDLTAPGALAQESRFPELAQKYRGELPSTFFRDNQDERTELHRSLRAWAAGPLELEHPQGSSFHHLVDYDKRCSPGEWAARMFEAHDPPQIFVVERDWARAFAGYQLEEGEVRLPFPHCCFEFRISGVRVLAFYHEEFMFCVYGRDGIWVSDDYKYHVDSGKRSQLYPIDAYEFPRVAKLVRDNVRVACIMVDADVATRETVSVSRVLVERKVKQGKAAPRPHYVIDLKRQRYHYRAPAGGGASGVKQRGHFRRGTWVHYSDHESGQVVYVNDGGFWLSRTWRPWHFAGDPNNLVDKEYRL